MKKTVSIIAALCITLCLLLPAVFAAGSGDPNVDGGGGGMGDGTGTDVWHVGDDGVRITVIRDSDNVPVSQAINISNKRHDIRFHGGANSKIDYRNGRRFSLQGKGSFREEIMPNPMPPIISPSGANSIAAVKQYFGLVSTTKYLADLFGFDYDRLTNGEYKLLIEPIAYFTYCGAVCALTATEAAIYNGLTSGDLRQKMYDLTHQNLPLAMFLETADLGFPAWSGGSRHVSDGEIISSLGLGIIRFKDAGQDAPVGTGDFSYRADTDVITSVMVSAAEDIPPDKSASVTFTINGKSYTRSFVCPQGEQALVWVRWHTPSAPCMVNMSVSSTHGALSYSSATADIKALKENTPPDPQGRDRNDGYSPPLPRGFNNATSKGWQEWSAYWKANWQWEADLQWEITGSETVPEMWQNPYAPSQTSSVYIHGWTHIPARDEDVYGWVDKGKWVDNGEWIFTSNYYTASLRVNHKLLPDAHCPTAEKHYDTWTIKSGYGVSLEMNAYVVTGGGAADAAVTGIQSCVSTFPEFNYHSYNRVLECTSGNRGHSVTYSFKSNPFSQWSSRTHFTPIWFPDSEYTISSVIFDAWTPAGQMYATTQSTVNIQGNVYDDWGIRPDTWR